MAGRLANFYHSNRCCALWELAAMLGLLELHLWLFVTWENRLASGLALAALAAVVWHSLRRRKLLSAAPQAGAALRAWGLALTTTLAMALVLLAAATALCEPYESLSWAYLNKTPPVLAEWSLRKLAVVVLQQALLLYFLWPLCHEILPRRGWGTVAAAAIFGLVHLPSWTLTAVTGAAAGVWLALFGRTGRVMPLVVSHAALAILAHAALPARLHYNMRVGAAALADADYYRFANLPQTRQKLRDLAVHEAIEPPETYVHALYADVAGRSPLSHETRRWTKRMRNRPRADVACELLLSISNEQTRYPVHQTYLPRNRK